MADDGMSKRVKDALKTLMQQTQYNGEDAFTHVYGTTQGEFDSWPVLRILPGDQTTEKASVAENDRTLAYILRVHLPLEDQADPSESTYDYMYDLTDLIIDALDEGDFVNVLHTIDSTIVTHFLDARRGDWFVTGTGAGVVLMCDVNVNVRYSKDLA